MKNTHDKVKPIKPVPDVSLEFSKKTSSLSSEQSETEDVNLKERKKPPIQSESETSKESGPIYSQLNYYRNWWFWELFCTTLSIISIFAVVILLTQIDGVALSRWTFFFQPNTILSVLLFLTKSTMLVPVAECISQLKWEHFTARRQKLADLETFDQASRGVWGSFIFLFKIGHRAPMALFGAVIMVVALYLDSLAQQLVNFETIETLSGEVATTPISNAYNELLILPRGDEYIPMSDTPIEGAIYKGIFGMKGLPMFNCPSGNCTWDDFYTLGACVSCSDVTNRTNVERGECNEKESRFVHTCAKKLYHTPGNLTLDALFTRKRDPKGGSKFASMTQIRSVAATAIGGYWKMAHITRGITADITTPNTTFTHSADVIVAVAIAQFPSAERYLNATVEEEIEPTHITECTLKWCLKKYEGVRVVNGSLAKFTTQDWPLYNPYLKQVFYANLSSDEISPWRSNEFEIRSRNVLGVERILSSLLNFHFMADGGIAYPYNWNPGQVLWENKNHSGIMENIAASMTDRIRENANPEQAYANGKVFRPVTYIKVKWEWLILPLSLVVMSSLLFCQAVIKKSEAPLWKSALLPLLFHGLEGWQKDDLKVEERHRIEDMARSMYVKLEKYEKRTTLARKDD